MESVLNVSAYLFSPLEDRETLRERLLARGQALGLRGTILLTPEGVNLFLAGPAGDLRTFLDEVREVPGLSGLTTKESWSQAQPFRKLLIKLKDEMIRMNHPMIKPSEGRAPSVSPTDLRRWLSQGHDDEGREVVMLDTRNAFEVDYGTFAGTLDWRIEKFSDFPAAVSEHRAELEGKTVVTFCTGGIRCEKANLYLHDVGLDNTLQLDGGILNYFEQVGGEHWEGDCFVFDEREALRPDLSTWDGETRRTPRRSHLAEAPEALTAPVR